MAMKRFLIPTVLGRLGVLFLVVWLCTASLGVWADQPEGLATGQRAIAAPQAQTVTPRAYLPIVFRQPFIDYWYEDNFENWDSGWQWGTNGFDYGYKQDSDLSRVYHIRMDDEDDIVFVTGPSQAKATANFDFESLLRRSTDKQPLCWGDQYGILLSPTPINPKSPSGAPVYTFEIELYIGDTYNTYYSVTKWNALPSNRTVLKRAGENDDLTGLAKFWNRLRIVRTGNTLDFYVSRQEGSGYRPWKHVYTYTDVALPANLYIGYYASHSCDDLGKYVVEFQFDNVKLHVYN
jgi:hypothetical protein